MKANDVVNTLTNFVNNCAFEPREFVDCMLKQHRTLQQQVFGLMLASIGRWADLSENEYDQRNEWTVETSKKIKLALKDCWFGSAPLI